MGLSTFPSPAEGVLPLLVMNTVLSLALLKNMVRSLLQGLMGSNLDIEDSEPEEINNNKHNNARKRRISITRFKSLCNNRCSSSPSSFDAASASSSISISATAGGSGGGRGGGWGNTSVECCCVCLCRFEADEEVSELSCKHFFHKGCLQKWFDNKHSTCPLCRSIDD